MSGSQQSQLFPSTVRRHKICFPVFQNQSQFVREISWRGIASFILKTNFGLNKKISEGNNYNTCK